jgi:hypothetical protein
MGKGGFSYLKRLIFGALRRISPAQRVSRSRYRVGLVLFTLALVLDWLEPYVQGLADRDGLHEMLQDVPVGLLLLFASVLVLGGEFWSKLRALFSYHAKADIMSTGSGARRRLG